MQVLQGDRHALSKSITLIESSLASHRAECMSLLSNLSPCPNTLRIGVCGSPGSGKSTLIETLGLHLLSLNHKLAVLAIDPSSVTHGGSILGDKTRMSELSMNPKAYIRPSPTRGVMGGVTVSCSESISLCESAGFTTVLVETVGLGQSELTVDEVTDLVMFVTTPAAGDSLQGIKKGIMEIADIIVINKADGPLKEKAKYTKFELESAVSMNLRRYESMPQVITCSALHREGIKEMWETVIKVRENLRKEIVEKRKKQMKQNSVRMLEALVRERIREMENSQEYEEIMGKENLPRAAAGKLLEMLLRNK